MATKYLHIYLEYNSVCPLVGIGTPPPPHPLSSKRVCPPPGTWGGTHSPACEGMGESQFGRLERELHKVSIYKEHHSLCPLVRIGTLPPPLSPASVPIPTNQGGAHSPVGKLLGESQFRRLEKSLALCLLCGDTRPVPGGFRFAA